VTTAVAPDADEYGREGSIGCGAGADRERIAEREEAFGNSQVF
jgi:hypothetical protein